MSIARRLAALERKLAVSLKPRRDERLPKIFALLSNELLEEIEACGLRWEAEGEAPAQEVEILDNRIDAELRSAERDEKRTPEQRDTAAALTRPYLLAHREAA